MSFPTSILGRTIVCALVSNTINGAFGGAITTFTCAFCALVTLIFFGRFLFLVFVFDVRRVLLRRQYRALLLCHPAVFGDLRLRLAWN